MASAPDSAQPAEPAKALARTSVWLEDGKRTRRRKAAADQPSGLDRDRITAATVRLLDAEGLAKFSMRRLAAELEVTAMSLYWYVDTKEDLLELACDAVAGEVPLPDSESGGDWRDQLRELAYGYRALMIHHPWLSPLVGRFLNIGPHWMALSLCVQRVIRNTGLPLDRQTGAIAAVFQFVYGFGTIEGDYVQRCAEAGLTQDEYFQQAMGSIGADPKVAEVMAYATEIMDARGGETVAEMRDRDFAFALDLMITGIESMAARAQR
ncbi:TetR/AcrR family transcriptional regulator [Streptomyces coeruleoprunus]|uniref:TetR/AcrR family transcriptional regulator n=1 Tax=Streptomyces coeruleoprunus TaxID=285563 RepID=A0ABV9XCY9_9ACTN